MSDELYELTIKNLPYHQATAWYRLLMDMPDEEQLHGTPGLSWSGQMPKQARTFDDVHRPARTVDIRPMRKPGLESLPGGMTPARADEFAQRVLGDLEPKPGESAQQYHERCLAAREKLTVAARASREVGINSPK